MQRPRLNTRVGGWRTVATVMFGGAGIALLAMSAAFAGNDDERNEGRRTAGSALQLSVGYDLIERASGTKSRRIKIDLRGRHSVFVLRCSGSKSGKYEYPTVSLYVELPGKLGDAYGEFSEQMNKATNLDEMMPDEHYRIATGEDYLVAGTVCGQESTTTGNTGLLLHDTSAVIEVQGDVDGWELAVGVAETLDGRWRTKDDGRTLFDETGAGTALRRVYASRLPKTSRMTRMIADCTGNGYLTIVVFGWEQEVECDASQKSGQAGIDAPNNEHFVLPGTAENNQFSDITVSPQLERLMSVSSDGAHFDPRQLVIVPSSSAGVWRVRIVEFHAEVPHIEEPEIPDEDDIMMTPSLGETESPPVDCHVRDEDGTGGPPPGPPTGVAPDGTCTFE